MRYIDLNKIYSKKKLDKEEIKEFYNENKSFFKDKFISFKYLELTPEILTKKKILMKNIFKKLDEIRK